MKRVYLIIIFLIIFATLLMCGFFVRYPVFGAEVDVLLVTMVLMIFFEKKLNPVIYAVLGGLIMDMLFARSIGFYTVPYLVCGLVVYLVSGNFKGRGIAGSAVLCMVAQVAKEFCSIIICTAQNGLFWVGNLIQTVTGHLRHPELKWLSFRRWDALNDAEELLRCCGQSLA